MKISYFYVVNPYSKITLGKFTSFSQAKTFQIVNKLLDSTQIWGYDVKELRSAKYGKVKQ